MSPRVDEIGFGGLKLLQDPCQFCYGVDAVLLADFCRAREDDNVCELGSGNGAVSLIISAKYHPAHITGVELQKGPYELSVESAKLNGLDDRVEFLNCDILDLKGRLRCGSMDLVVTNPPYIEKGRGFISCESPQSLARHESSACLQDFMNEAARLLRCGGRLCMVHRPSRLPDITENARAAGLEPKKLVPVAPKKGEPSNIILIECIKGAGKGLQVMAEVVIREPDGSFTEELKRIYSR
ncbi:MAG: tRNA1(Val) (adenine(37)-N6)-methyltransferase [Firmicutes bacterium]|nr:tRNA1(Val) (adenine(37)-N6)-methyltransferase [Bacillota bacterium]